MGGIQLPASDAWTLRSRRYRPVVRLHDAASAPGVLRTRDPDLRPGVRERQFTEATLRVLVEDHGIDARLGEKIAEQVGFGQGRGGAEAMHAAV